MKFCKKINLTQMMRLSLARNKCFKTCSEAICRGEFAEKPIHENELIRGCWKDGMVLYIIVWSLQSRMDFFIALKQQNNNHNHNNDPHHNHTGSHTGEDPSCTNFEYECLPLSRFGFRKYQIPFRDIHYLYFMWNQSWPSVQLIPIRRQITVGQMS